MDVHAETRSARRTTLPQKGLDDVTGAIIDSALNLHRQLGPGLLESVYEIVLARDLARRGFVVERQKPVSFDYDGLQFDDAFRLDLFAAGSVIVEVKSIEKVHPVHHKQVLTYLRLLKLPVGLLINFGAPTLKEGLHRIVNGLQPSASPREPAAHRQHGATKRRMILSARQPHGLSFARL